MSRDTVGKEYLLKTKRKKKGEKGICAHHVSAEREIELVLRFMLESREREFCRDRKDIKKKKITKQ